MTVAEAALNVACVGARPVALVNCLNFGNPEHPEVMWQLSEAIDGMAEACRVLDLPVVGGNVSLYNESRGRDIDPTPVIGVVGLIDELDRVPPGLAAVPGAVVLLLGTTQPVLGGSLVARRQGVPGAELPDLDLVAHVDLLELVRELVAAGNVMAAHDVSVGGLAVTLAEMAMAGSIGMTIDAITDSAALFSESPSRVVVCVDPSQSDAVTARAAARGVPASTLGQTGGDRIVIDGLVDLAVAEVAGARRDRLPSALGAGTAR